MLAVLISGPVYIIAYMHAVFDPLMFYTIYGNWVNFAKVSYNYYGASVDR